MSNAAYDQLAEEYYDLSHKTSRNFDQTTATAFAEAMPNIPQEGLVLDVGAGKGRAHEFLGIDLRRVIQLDNSAAMLALETRERSLLRIAHEAERLPFLASTFAGITAFLCDPYLGLDFLSEAFRVLVNGGILIATTPAYEWAVALRGDINMSLMQTRFVTRTGATLVVPSIIHTSNKLREMLEFVGFKKKNIILNTHRLPSSVTEVSKDIEEPARRRKLTSFEIDLLYTIVATK